MYLDLDNIEKELEKNDLYEIEEEITISDIDKDTRDFNIVTVNNIIYFKDSTNLNINQVYNFNKNNNNLDDISTNSDIAYIESLIKELEDKLGLKLFKDVYYIIQDNVINKIKNILKLD